MLGGGDVEIISRRVTCRAGKLDPAECLHKGVGQVALRQREGGLVVLHEPLEGRLQRAAQKVLDLRRRQGGLPAVYRWVVLRCIAGGGAARGPPLVGVCSRHACLRQPGELTRGLLARVRGFVLIAQHAAQARDETGDGQHGYLQRVDNRRQVTFRGGVSRNGIRRDGVSASGNHPGLFQRCPRRCHQLPDEPRRLLHLVGVRGVDRHDRQAAAVPRRGHVEQAPFFRKTVGEVADRIVWIDVMVDEIHQLGLVEQGAGLPEGRPVAFLRAGNHDGVPLVAHRPVRGENRDRLRHRGAPIAHPGGQFLFLDVGDERSQGAVGAPLGEVTRGIEKRHHRVQVAVGLRAGRTTAQGRALEASI